MNKPIDFCMQQVSRVPSLPFETLSSLPQEAAGRLPPIVFNLPPSFLAFCRFLSMRVSNVCDEEAAWQLLPLYPRQDIHGTQPKSVRRHVLSRSGARALCERRPSRHRLTCRRTRSIDPRALSYKTLRMWARLSLPLPSARCISAPNIGNVCMPLKQSALFIQSPWTSRIRKFPQWILIGEIPVQFISSIPPKKKTPKQTRAKQNKHQNWLSPFSEPPAVPFGWQ